MTTLEPTTSIPGWQEAKSNLGKEKNFYFRIGEAGELKIEQANFFKRIWNRKQFRFANCVSTLSEIVERTNDRKFLSFCLEKMERYKSGSLLDRFIGWVRGRPAKKIPKEVVSLKDTLEGKIVHIWSENPISPFIPGIEKIGAVQELQHKAIERKRDNDLAIYKLISGQEYQETTPGSLSRALEEVVQAKNEELKHAVDTIAEAAKIPDSPIEKVPDILLPISAKTVDEAVNLVKVSRNLEKLAIRADEFRKAEITTFNRSIGGPPLLSETAPWPMIQNAKQIALPLQELFRLAIENPPAPSIFEKYKAQVASTVAFKDFTPLLFEIQNDITQLKQARQTLEQVNKNIQDWEAYIQQYLILLHQPDTKTGLFTELKNFENKITNASTLEEVSIIDKEFRDFSLRLPLVPEELSKEVAALALKNLTPQAYGKKSVAARVEPFIQKYLQPTLLSLLTTTKKTAKEVLLDPTTNKQLGVIKCRYVTGPEGTGRVEIAVRAFLGEGSCGTVEAISYLAGPTFERIGSEVQAYKKWQKNHPAYRLLKEMETKTVSLLTHAVVVGSPPGMIVQPPLTKDGHVLVGNLVTKCKDPSAVKAIMLPFCDMGDYSDTTPIFDSPTCTPDQRREAFQDVIDGAKGLQALHERGCVHLDVKPENFFRKKTIGGRIKGFLADLGFVTKTSDYIGRRGSPLHVAPEFATLPAFYPLPSMDMWSFGLVLVERLFGGNYFYNYDKFITTTFDAMSADPKKAYEERTNGRNAVMAALQAYCLAHPKDVQVKWLVDLIGALLEEDPNKRPTAAAAIARLTFILSNYQAQGLA